MIVRFITTLSLIFLLSCGNVNTGVSVNNQDPNSENPIENPSASNKIGLTSVQLSGDTSQDINIDLSTLIEDFSASEKYNYLIITPPSKGFITLTNGVLNYSPSSTGVDTIEFKVSTKDRESNVGVLTFSISAPSNPDAPTSGSGTLSISDTFLLTILENQSKTIDLINLIKNKDSNATYNFGIVAKPTGGQASISGTSLTYTPSAGQVGSDSLSVRAGDGQSTSNICTITVEIEDLRSSTPQWGDLNITLEDVGPHLIDLSTLLLPPHPFSDKTYTFTITRSSQLDTGNSITGSILTYTPIQLGLTDSSLRVQVEDDLGQTSEGNFKITTNFKN